MTLGIRVAATAHRNSTKPRRYHDPDFQHPRTRRMIPEPIFRKIIPLIVVSLLLTTTGIAPVAAHQDHEVSPTFQIDLNRDGSAQVSILMVYHLDTDDERLAFQTLQNDSEARADARDRFTSRMSTVASDASTAIGRQMTVSEAAIDLSVSDDGSLGIVRLSVAWSNFAGLNDGELVVTEPLASGLQIDRQVVMTLPDGYTVMSVTPEADAVSDGRLVWRPGTDFSGFELVATPDEDSQGSAVSSPGLGVPIALLALLGAGVLFKRHGGP